MRAELFASLAALPAIVWCGISLLATSLVAVYPPDLQAQVSFEEIAGPAGIDHTGQSWGSSWGDFNMDGWPDLWTGNHFSAPSLYLNMKDGTFQEIASQVIAPETWTQVKPYDSHGAAWADFDNDGDQDLIQQVDGGTPVQPNQLYVNIDGQRFDEQAASWNVDLPLGRGRTPLWFDWNNDGLLDILFTHLPHSGGTEPALLYEQTYSEFENVTGSAGLNVLFSNHALLSDIDSSGSMELLVAGPKGSPVLGLDSTPFTTQNEALGLGTLAGVVDVLSADLDGDLDNDLFIVRGPKRSSVIQTDGNTIEASIGVSGQEFGFRFSTAGAISFDLYPKWKFNPSTIFIGAGGTHPTDTQFSLSGDESFVDGIASHNAGTDAGVYIGYDRNSQSWQLLLSDPGWNTLNLVIAAVEPVFDLAAIGFDPEEPPPGDRLLYNNNGVFEDHTLLAGIDQPSSGHNTVAGDFDNDMDLDLYIVAVGPVQNLPNLLYENVGGGQFVAAPASSAAAGTSLGRGGTASVCDFDRDGFLDLLTTNGKSPEPFYFDGPYQLFRNLGNANHWIALDLEGVKSNRDGVGTSVVATAGGVAQLREQNGGMHFRTQNHQRIHFGLAANTVVDTLTVEWPSGIVQTIENLPADEIVHVLEPSYPVLLGQPGYVSGQDVGLYLWKDSFDGPYHMEVNGDGPLSIFSVELIADQPLASVTPRLLEVNDTLAWDTNHLRFVGRVTSGLDGLDFRLSPGSRAMLAVARNGVSNPRQLHIGASGDPLTPAGWVLAADTLPALPAFQGGVDLGLFAGRANGQVRARWNGDGPNHYAELELLFSQTPTAVTPVGFESNDTLATTAYSVAAEGVVSVGWDGLNLDLPAGTRMGLAYTQDGLVQPHRVNPASRNLGLPNAYRLPRAEPYGAPAYDPGTEAGLYLWQDKATGTWRLRGAAGSGGGRYTGEIVSDQPFTGVSAVSIEANDVLDTTDPMRIVFDLGMWNQWEDGIDFQAVPGAQLSLNLTTGSPFATPGKAVRIGESKWPVDNLPLNLDGW